MTFATLCDQCGQRVDGEKWRVKIEVRPSANWLKRAFVPGADIVERKELHFCSAACVAAWATHLDESGVTSVQNSVQKPPEGESYSCDCGQMTATMPIGRQPCCGEGSS